MTASGKSYTERAELDPTITLDYIRAVRGAYARDQELTSPMLSPLFGDFRGFPPTLIQAGSNELLLSDVLGTDGDIVMRPLEDDVDHQLLRQALGRLPEREKQIVCMRFGLGGRQEKTQKEVADIMGISQSYISRLEKRIMLRLRREISRQIYS